MGGKKLLSQTDADSDAEKTKTNDPAEMRNALKKTVNPVTKGSARSDQSSSNVTKKTKVTPVSNDAPQRKVITDVISQDIENVDPEIGMALASLEPMKKPTGPRVNNRMAQVDSDAEGLKKTNDVAATKAALKTGTKRIHK